MIPFTILCILFCFIYYLHHHGVRIPSKDASRVMTGIYDTLILLHFPIQEKNSSSNFF